MKPILHTGMACAMFVASYALSMPAQATLGQDVSTTAADSAFMQATSHVADTRTGYTLHVITLASGTLVREYAAPDGTVFGVAWEGPTLPDLKTILGTAFDRYVSANQTRRATPLAVSGNDLVIFSSGHLRAFAGHAYLPLAVPAGVDIGVIQ